MRLTLLLQQDPVSWLTVPVHYQDSPQAERKVRERIRAVDAPNLVAAAMQVVIDQASPRSRSVAVRLGRT